MYIPHISIIRICPNKLTNGAALYGTETGNQTLNGIEMGEWGPGYVQSSLPSMDSDRDILL